ncbi:hypothetical protein, partial [Roseibium sp.]|uniref:hypothetical protein n=1 Tax=Roseibium sp. TaxID=1936156 RepID=UPI003299EF16
MNSIESYLKNLLETAWKCGFTPTSFSKKAGVDRSVFATVKPGGELVIGPGAFNPTARVVRALEIALGDARKPSGDVGSSEFAGAVVRCEESRGRQHSMRVMLADRVIPLLASELSQVDRYCEGLRRDHGG